MTQSPSTLTFSRSTGHSGLAGRLDALVACYFAAYAPVPEYGYERHDEVERYLTWLLDRDPTGLYVAENAGELAGWCAVTGEWRGWRDDLNEPITELQELVVDPRWQGNGLGRRFLAGALDHAHQAGRSTIGLWVGEHNERAKALYLRNGFAEVSRWKIWIRMTRTLEVER